jgi:hypothetical protein
VASSRFGRYEVRSDYLARRTGPAVGFHRGTNKKRGNLTKEHVKVRKRPSSSLVTLNDIQAERTHKLFRYAFYKVRSAVRSKLPPQLLDLTSHADFELELINVGQKCIYSAKFTMKTWHPTKSNEF